jgi:hypothetical protein
MIPALISGTIDKLSSDLILQGYIGVDNVFKAGRAAPEQIPSITVRSNNESSKSQNGAIHTRRRDATGMIQIDIWIPSDGEEFPCQSEDADMIQLRVEEVLMNPLSPVTGTGTWEKISESQQEGEGLWHNVVRFHLAYSLIDT